MLSLSPLVYSYLFTRHSFFKRFNIFKNLAVQKKVDIFLLEKFMFLKKSNYLYAQKKCDLKNIYNNV